MYPIGLIMPSLLTYGRSLVNGVYILQSSITVIMIITTNAMIAANNKIAKAPSITTPIQEAIVITDTILSPQFQNKSSSLLGFL